MRILFYTSILFYLFQAHAGEKGNGGYSVVCRDNSGMITSAELLDIYEGRILYKRAYAVDMNSVEELIEIAKSRLAEHGGFLSKLEKELSAIHQNLIFIPDGNELQPTDDAFPPIKKKGCQFEQLANYTNAGEVLVSQEIYDRLDNVNKAALFIHEAVYAIRRKAVADTNSQVSRRITAHLMATNPDSAVIDRWVGDTVYRPNIKRPCGLTGGIKERMESCSYLEQGIAPFSLVTRTKDGHEVWIDTEANLLWSDRLKQAHTFDSASTACLGPAPEMGGLNVADWRLPTAEEFAAQSQVMIYQLPNFKSFNENDNIWFWTSTIRGRSIQIFNGADGKLGTNIFRKSLGSVRCVAPLR